MIRMYRSTGIMAVSFNKSDSIQSFIGKIYTICLSLLFVSAIFMAFFSAGYKFLIPFTYLETPLIQIIGLIINQISIIWIIIGQIQMEKSWRIGIYDEEKTKLIKTGLFKVSRHPIFLGLIVLLFSSFLCMPNAITFAVFSNGFVLIQIEALLEEKELHLKHGDQYKKYCHETGRWLKFF
jgi:protein-S-isoprenylcysteine O-methyltransferase Ste14